MILSVIVPVYNAEKYLRDCLDSLVRFPLQNVEFIIVNDGSRDSSARICAEYQKLDSRFKYLEKSNGGVSSARNIGMRNATGDYILFLDSDDRISERLSCAVECCLSKNISFLVLKRYYITRDCPEFVYDISTPIFAKITDCLYEIKDYKKLLLTKFYISGSAEILFKSTLIQDIQFNENLSLLEDFDFFLRVLDLNTPKVYLYNECVTYINDEVEGSLTKKKRNIDTVSPGTIGNNPFLLKHPKLNGKILCFEIYFHFKQLSYSDRFKYIYRYGGKIIKKIILCKYLIGAVFLLIFNVDINRMRIMLKNIFKSK